MSGKLIVVAIAACLPCLANASATSAPIPYKSAAASGGQGSAVGVLLVCALVIAVVLWGRKRWLPLAGRLTGERPVRVLQTQRLGPGAMVSVVEFAGNRYLLAQSPQGINCLATAPAEPAGSVA